MLLSGRCLCRIILKTFLCLLFCYYNMLHCVKSFLSIRVFIPFYYCHVQNLHYVTVLIWDCFQESQAGHGLFSWVFLHLLLLLPFLLLSLPPLFQAKKKKSLILNYCRPIHFCKFIFPWYYFLQTLFFKFVNGKSRFTSNDFVK